MLPNIFTIISQQILCGKLFTNFNLDPIQTSLFTNNNFLHKIYYKYVVDIALLQK